MPLAGNIVVEEEMVETWSYNVKDRKPVRGWCRVQAIYVAVILYQFYNSKPWARRCLLPCNPYSMVNHMNKPANPF